jgi:hypothetical protein
VTPADKGEEQLGEVLKLARLNSSQQDKIRYLLRNPGGAEFDLFKRLLGLTPSQARTLIVEEFWRRFQPTFSLELLLARLRPARSWLDLDRKIRDFTVTRRHYYEMLGMGKDSRIISPDLSKELETKHDLELDFWDKMRYLLEALPKTREFRDKYWDKAKRKNPKRGWDYETCELCWRTVPVNAELRQKTGVLCFEHDLPASNGIYRKHRRLWPEVQTKAQDILKILKEWYPRGLSNDEIGLRIKNEVTGSDSVLPALVTYMNAGGHTCEPGSLLAAFHGPFPKDLDLSYQEAMKIFFQDAVKFPYLFTLDELALAEAWLAALKSDRRKKSGIANHVSGTKQRY